MDRNNVSWLVELKLRDESALKDLRAMLLRNLRRAMANRPRADEPFLEDVVQESLLKILDKLDQFAGRSQFVTWATAIAIRTALSQLRRSQWKNVSLNDVLSGVEFSDTLSLTNDSPPDALVNWQGLLDTLQKAITGDLTDRQRIALVAELKGMPTDEIAQHLDCNRNAIYKLTHDARKTLKKSLEAAGYAADDVVTTSAN